MSGYYWTVFLYSHFISFFEAPWKLLLRYVYYESSHVVCRKVMFSIISVLVFLSVSPLPFIRYGHLVHLGSPLPTPSFYWQVNGWPSTECVLISHSFNFIGSLINFALRRETHILISLWYKIIRYSTQAVFAFRGFVNLAELCESL